MKAAVDPPVPDLAEAGATRSLRNAEGITRSRKVAQSLCFLALVFASADVWPKLTLGFTFRLSQLFVYLAIPLLIPTLRSARIQSFPGAIWCIAWLAWTTLTLPLSLYLIRSVGYAFWLASNLLIIFVFVQSFRTISDAKRLINWLLISFILIAAFGILQLCGAVVGIDILISEWWIKGLIPRVNGLSYEPSYYATYLIPGWVLSLYFIENNVVSISRRVVLLCAWSTSIALFVCTSRLGWGLMLFWIFVRSTAKFVRYLLGKRASFRIVRRNILVLLLMPVTVVGIGFHESDKLEGLFNSAAFFLGGIGLFGTTSQSADDRADGFQLTFNAFLAHPVMGTGLGAVPVEIAAQRHSAVDSLEDAKQNEGMSIIVELLASIGAVGFAIVSGLMVDLAVKYRMVYRRLTTDERKMFRGVVWAIAWIVLALQFNQNFLRIYLWMDVAVLISMVAAYLRADKSQFNPENSIGFPYRPHKNSN